MPQLCLHRRVRLAIALIAKVLRERLHAFGPSLPVPPLSFAPGGSGSQLSSISWSSSRITAGSRDKHRSGAARPEERFVRQAMTIVEHVADRTALLSHRRRSGHPARIRNSGPPALPPPACHRALTASAGRKRRWDRAASLVRRQAAFGRTCHRGTGSSQAQTLRMGGGGSDALRRGGGRSMPRASSVRVGVPERILDRLRHALDQASVNSSSTPMAGRVTPVRTGDREGEVGRFAGALSLQAQAIARSPIERPPTRADGGRRFPPTGCR